MLASTSGDVSPDSEPLLLLALPLPLELPLLPLSSSSPPHAANARTSRAMMVASDHRPAFRYPVICTLPLGSPAAL